MKKIAILLIAFLAVAVFISGCSTSENETIVVTDNGDTTSDIKPTEFVGGDMSCEDSDDGKDKETKGTISGVDIDGNTYEYEDECVATWLVEYFCDGDEQKNQNFICDNDCQNGACV